MVEIGGWFCLLRRRFQNCPQNMQLSSERSSADALHLISVEKCSSADVRIFAVFFCALPDFIGKITLMRSGSGFIPHFPKKGNCAKNVEDPWVKALSWWWKGAATLIFCFTRWDRRRTRYLKNHNVYLGRIQEVFWKKNGAKNKKMFTSQFLKLRSNQAPSF